MDEQVVFNREVDNVLYDAAGHPRDPDVYPDSPEGRAELARCQEAEVLGVDPSTVDLLGSGQLGL